MFYIYPLSFGFGFYFLPFFVFLQNSKTITSLDAEAKFSLKRIDFTKIKVGLGGSLCEPQWNLLL